MDGGDRVRFCSQCQLHVYNLSAMNRREAELLLARREGRLCVRLYRRADGTVLTQDCPVGLRAWRRRVAWVSALAAAVLIGVIGLGASVLASSGRRHQPDGNPAVSLIRSIRDWLFPPARVNIVMGDIAPPVPVPANPPPPAPPDDPQ
jgi:hypothetical protein